MIDFIKRIFGKRKPQVTEISYTGHSTILSQHYAYMEQIEVNYREREKDPAALGRAIEACRRQIAIAPRAAIEFKSDMSFAPAHTGYKQLAIILEKQGNIQEAIELCEQARDQGWSGDWEKRIARYRKKLTNP